MINFFLNFNRGERPVRREDLFHVDHPTQPDINTGRVIYYVMSPGETASLDVRRGDAEVEHPVRGRPLGSAAVRSPCWPHTRRTPGCSIHTPVP